jgi:glycosyltransferase involved in cell wall biosynthesis
LYKLDKKRIITSNMLSVVICTWNEQESLPRVVASVKDLADEIIVVDTESSDHTVEVAKKLGCKVFHHKNTGIVEPVRNFSISKAKEDWILLLDADEEVSVTLANAIRQTVSQNKVDFCRIPRKNIIFNKWIRSAHWWPDYVYRLFKKGSVVWDDTIHSIPTTKGVGFDYPVDENYSLTHYNYTTVSQFLQRLDRYTDHQLKHLQASNYRFIWKDLISKPFSEFIRQYFARSGYKDGAHGLALSMLMAFSELVLYLKVWQTEHFYPVPINPEEVHKAFQSQTDDYAWWLTQSQIDRASFPVKIFLKLARHLGL